MKNESKMSHFVFCVLKNWDRKKTGKQPMAQFVPIQINKFHRSCAKKQRKAKRKNKTNPKNTGIAFTTDMDELKSPQIPEWGLFTSNTQQTNSHTHTHPQTQCW